ncbi:hypothetical protein QVD17_32451 [Tagetes erecta]|uniref:Calcium uniporter protein n=1 Tax=Tagetes erecta TaxID=13708 RepID=A0AAD8JXU2_TARER|nr:hypothetical protein QVD17_32451 [Tagetes erecta]
MSKRHCLSMIAPQNYRQNAEMKRWSNQYLPNFDGVKVPATERLPVSGDAVGLSVNDARKILRFSQLQKVRSALKQIPMNSISYSEFIAICVDSCNDDEQGVEFSKMLDHAGDVIVLGNVVFIRPDQCRGPN